MKELLTLKEVAKYLRVSERSVLRYIESGKLKASKIGHWRIFQKDVEKSLAKKLNSKSKK